MKWEIKHIVPASGNATRYCDMLGRIHTPKQEAHIDNVTVFSLSDLNILLTGLAKKRCIK